MVSDEMGSFVHADVIAVRRVPHERARRFGRGRNAYRQSGHRCRTAARSGRGGSRSRRRSSSSSSAFGFKFLDLPGQRRQAPVASRQRSRQPGLVVCGRVEPVLDLGQHLLSRGQAALFRRQLGPQTGRLVGKAPAISGTRQRDHEGGHHGRARQPGEDRKDGSPAHIAPWSSRLDWRGRLRSDRAAHASPLLVRTLRTVPDGTADAKAV